MTTKSMAAKVAAKMVKSFLFWNCLVLVVVLLYAFISSALRSTVFDLQLFSWTCATVTLAIYGLLIYNYIADLKFDIEREEAKKSWRK